MILTTRILAIFLVLLTLQTHAVNEKKMSPRMKVVDRDWSYFQDIPCKDIDKIKTYSAHEKKLLEKRKGECLNQYKAFFPKPGPKQ
jgi:hypothetical protein